MTAPACPVCATPYEAGATICAFCGVSLVGPEPRPAAKPKSRAKPAPKPRVEPDIRAIESPSPTPVEVVEPIADEVSSPAPLEAAEPGTGESPSPAPVEVAESKVDELPAPVEIVEPIADETSPPTPAGVDGVDATPPALDPDAESAEAAETSIIPEDSMSPAPPAPGTQAPSFANERAAATAAQRRLQRIEWGVVAGLAVLLLVQVVASDFGPLAANGATRPWLQGICNALRCSLPAWHEPRALHLLQRDVRANPQHPGLLRISASFRNEARWTQPWPRLRVTLSDADGRTIAARDFAANEYLGAEPTTNGIASGQLASVAFDVADPSPRVTAFTFEFR